MKNYKKIVCAALSAAVLAAPLASTPAAVQAAAPKLNKTSVSLAVGKKVTLKVRNVKSGTKIKWSSSKKTVASVSSKGVVTAKAAGTAKIKAVVSKKTLTCTVTVKKAAANTKVQDISALLAGRSYKGTAATPVGSMDALNLTFGSDGTVTGSKLNETTLALEEFSGTYKAVLSNEKVTITVEAGGKTISYELTAESADYSKLSMTVNVMGMDISVQVQEVKA